MPDFNALIAAAEKDPHHADFALLRRAYLESDRYAPTNHLSYAKLQGYTNSCEDFDEVVIFCKKALEANPMDLEVRMLLDFAYDQLEQHDLAEPQQAFISGMLDAIFKSGDGKSFATAWKVVSVAEEYTLLSVMGLVPQKQALADHEGRFYDIQVCTARRDPTAAPIELYFDVTSPILYLQNTMR